MQLVALFQGFGMMVGKLLPPDLIYPMWVTGVTLLTFSLREICLVLMAKTS